MSKYGTRYQMETTASKFLTSIKLLQEVPELDLQKLSFLEKEGIIQRFKYTFELAWKTLKGKMEDIKNPQLQEHI